MTEEAPSANTGCCDYNTDGSRHGLWPPTLLTESPGRHAAWRGRLCLVYSQLGSPNGRRRRAMKRQEVVALLSRHRPALDRAGVKSLALFGSMARDEASDTSDVDLIVEFERPTGLFGLIRLEQQLEQLLGRPVDLTTPDGLKPRIRDQVLSEAVYVR